MERYVEIILPILDLFSHLGVKWSEPKKPKTVEYEDDIEAILKCI